MKKFALISSLVLIGLILYLVFPYSTEDKSICYGSTKFGRIEAAVRLPMSGKNFSTYSRLGSLLGRTYVHKKVYASVLLAYKKMLSQKPDTVFVYAETGWRNGGRFRPHKTHQNGLSIDFMVPVLNETNQSVALPTSFTNKLGYGIEFDKNNKYNTLRLDFESMAAHLALLHQSAKQHKIAIWRIFFDPQLQPKLFNTKFGPYIKKHLKFSTRRSWVRHDEHYHVDFKIPCKPL